MKINMYQIQSSSIKAIELAKSSSQKGDATKYPFDKLEVGQSFSVPFLATELTTSKKEASLRVNACIKAKKTGKTFKVIKHREFNCIEVARIK